MSWGLESAYDTLFGVVFALSAAGVGALILSRHPSHPIGWLSAIAGLVVSLTLLLGEYATSTALAAPGAPRAERPRHAARLS